MATIASIDVRLSAIVAGFNRSMKQASKSLKVFERDVAAVKRTTLNLGAVVLGAVGVGSLKAFVGSQMEAIDSTAKLSDRLGISTEALQGLRHGASLAGTSVEEFDSNLEKMVRTIGAAAMGNAKAQKAFEAIGLSAAALSAMPVEEQFKTIASAIARIENPAAKARAAFLLFGRSGQEMINFLDTGREGIEAMQRDAEALGIAFDRVDAAKVEAANDALERVGGVIRGVGQTIAIELSPFITAAADAFTRWATEGHRSSSIVISAIEGMASAVAFLADAWDVVGLAFDVVQKAITEGLAKLTDIIAEWAKSIEPYLEKFLGFEIDTSGLESFANELRVAAAGMSDEIDKALVAESHGEHVRKVFADIRKNAQLAAQQVAADMEQNAAAVPLVDLAAQEEERKKLMEEGERVWRKSLTPLQEYLVTLNDLQRLLEAGAIDQATFDRAKEQARSKFDPASKKGLAAEVAGSKEAFATIAAFRRRGEVQKDKDDIAKQQLERQQAMDAKLQQMINLLGDGVGIVVQGV